MTTEAVVIFSVKAFFLVGSIHAGWKGKWLNCLGMVMIMLLIAGVEWSLPQGMGFMSLVNGDMDDDQALQVMVGAMMFSGMILSMCAFLAPSIAKTMSEPDA